MLATGCVALHTCDMTLPVPFFIIAKIHRRSRPRLMRHGLTQHAPAMCPRQQLHHHHRQAAWQRKHLVQRRCVPRPCPGGVHLASVPPPRKLDAHQTFRAAPVARRVQQLVVAEVHHLRKAGSITQRVRKGDARLAGGARGSARTPRCGRREPLVVGVQTAHGSAQCPQGGHQACHGQRLVAQ